MIASILRLLACVVIGAAIWSASNLAGSTSEPWDGPYFFHAYAAVLIASLVWGLAFPRPSWLWGAATVFAIWPVMIWENPALGPLVPVGLLMTFFLAGPGALTSWAGYTLRNRMRRPSRPDKV